MACEGQAIDRTHVLFSLASTNADELFTLPYPNDLRRREDGTLDLAQLEQDQPGLLQHYFDVISRNRAEGFGLNSAAYFRFSGPLDESSLPQSPAESLSPSASVVWVNIQPDSPEYGQCLPLRFKFSASRGNFIGENNLAIVPVAGFSLLPNTQYAVILNETLRDREGQSIAAAPDYLALINPRPPDSAARQQAYETYAPLRRYLSERGRTGTLAAALFTTGQPTMLMKQARQVLMQSRAPQSTELKIVDENEHYFEIQGKYPAPNFQQGTVPYYTPADGGEIALSDHGLPLIARHETMRFSITIPQGPMPAAGWPVVLYAHGTGGDFRSFIRAGIATQLASVVDDHGALVAQLAVVGIDQNLHGTRVPEGSNPDFTFFNIQNPAASVYNVLQGGIDNYSLLRMINELVIDRLAVAGGAAAGAIKSFAPPLRFDPQRIYFMGHSQGALTGPPFLAYAPEVKAVVLSGAGGKAVLSLLNKTQPVAIRPLLQLALNEELDEFHPVLNLLQQLLEPAETLNYAPLLLRHPGAGMSPKHLFISQGLVDHYTPNATTFALALGLELPPLWPVLEEDPALLRLRHVTEQMLPTAGNISIEQHAITAGFQQFRAPATGHSCSTDEDCRPFGGYCDELQCREDGHFVIFDVPRAIRQYSWFLATAVRDGVPSFIE